MKKETPKRLNVKGVGIPRWYLELEPTMLELMNTIAEAKEKLDALRTTVLTMMNEDGIDGIETEFTKVTKVKGFITETVLKDKLKEEMPEVYVKYIKTTYKKPSITIKLVEAKEGK